MPIKYKIFINFPNILNFSSFTSKMFLLVVNFAKYKIINKGSIAPVSVYRAFIRELIRIPKRKNNPESIFP